MMIRREAKESFTWVHNTFIRDKRLSLAERGMLILLMSLPNDWKFTIAGIKSMVEDGREKVSSTLKALEKHGYLRRVQQYDENGGFTDLLYTFSDEPVFLEGTRKLGEENFTKISAENDGNAGVMPMTENPSAETTLPSNPSYNNNYNNELLIYESITKENMCCRAAQASQPEQMKTASSDVHEGQDKGQRKGQTKKSRKSIDNAVYDAIVAHLNEKAHTNYKPTTESTRRLINARLAEGHSVEDFMTVIDHKCAEWLGSGMAQYLRPQTLFGTKFEGYLNAPDYTTICYKNRQQNTQEAPVERDYSTNMIDLLNEYLGE